MIVGDDIYPGIGLIPAPFAFRTRELVTAADCKENVAALSLGYLGHRMRPFPCDSLHLGAQIVHIRYSHVGTSNSVAICPDDMSWEGCSRTCNQPTYNSGNWELATEVPFHTCTE